MVRKNYTGANERQAPRPKSNEFDLEALVHQQEQLTKAAETLFSKLAGGGELSSGEWSLLRSAGPHPGGTPSHDRSAFQRWLDGNVGRLRTIREKQQRAGTAEDRAQARTAAELAAAELAAAAPRIEQQIAELQEQLATLARNAKVASDQVRQQEQAVEALRQVDRLPAWIQDELKAANRRHVAEWKRDLVSAQGRIRTIEAIVGIDTSAPDAFRTIELHVGSTPTLGVDNRSRVERFFTFRRVVDPETKTSSERITGLKRGEWDRYLDTLRAEAEQVKIRVEELLPLKEAAEAEIEQLTSFYVS